MAGVSGRGGECHTRASLPDSAAPARRPPGLHGNREAGQRPSPLFSSLLPGAPQSPPVRVGAGALRGEPGQPSRWGGGSGLCARPVCWHWGSLPSSQLPILLGGPPGSGEPRLGGSSPRRELCLYREVPSGPRSWQEERQLSSLGRPWGGSGPRPGRRPWSTGPSPAHRAETLRKADVVQHGGQAGQSRRLTERPGGLAMPTAGFSAGDCGLGVAGLSGVRVWRHGVKALLCVAVGPQGSAWSSLEWTQQMPPTHRAGSRHRTSAQGQLST